MLIPKFYKRKAAFNISYTDLQLHKNEFFANGGEITLLEPTVVPDTALVNGKTGENYRPSEMPMLVY